MTSFFAAMPRSSGHCWHFWSASEPDWNCAKPDRCPPARTTVRILTATLRQDGNRARTQRNRSPRSVFWDQRLEPRADVRVGDFAVALQPGHEFPHRGAVGRSRLGDAQLRVVRRQRRLFRGQGLLEELFSRTQARENDADAVWITAGKPHHAARKMHYGHRL